LDRLTLRKLAPPRFVARGSNIWAKFAWNVAHHRGFMAMEESLPASVADLAILGQLLEEHRSRLLAMLGRRIDPKLHLRLDPEDILSEAFLQARRRWTAYQAEPKMKPYAWLYRIALDCLIDAYRRETRGRNDLHKEMPMPEGTSAQLGLGLINAGTSPSEAVAREEVRQRVQQALGLLKETDREILWMRHHDQLSFAEAASILGLTENTATVRYARALRRLKDLWLQIYEPK
jgi:RNA polymerase sigma-70 factor (ECF subfamily)